MGATERLAGLVHDAEQHLVLSCWPQAEAAAAEALQRSVYLSDCLELQDRAATVLLQASSFCRPSKFAGSRKELISYFGSLEAVPPAPLLLWLSLALDEPGSKQEAQTLIVQLLQAKQPDMAGGWSRRQYLALLHLYLFEVLLPELCEVAEAARWLQATQLPLQPEERQMLLDELLALQPHPAACAAQQAQHGQRSSSGSHGGNTSSCCCRSKPGPSAGAAAEAGEQQQQQQQQQQGRYHMGDDASEEIQEESGEQWQQGQEQGVAAPGRPLPRSGGGSGSSLPSASAAGAAGARLVQRSLSMTNHYSQGWAGLAWQQLAAALAAVQAYVGSWGFSGGGSLAAGVGGGAPPVTVRAAVRAALAAVVLYALYAERQAIRRRLGRTRQAVWTALSELVRMGLSLSPNPMAAPR